MSKKPATPEPTDEPTDTPTLPPLPQEMLDALGGAPIPVPPMVARRVAGGAGDSPAPASPTPTRVSNPLFDEPSPGLVAERAAIRKIRTAYGTAAQAMDAAAKQFRSAGKIYPDLAAAAAKEDFDLKAAEVVAGEFTDFLDRYKPEEGRD